MSFMLSEKGKTFSNPCLSPEFRRRLPTFLLFLPLPFFFSGNEERRDLPPSYQEDDIDESTTSCFQ